MKKITGIVFVLCGLICVSTTVTYSQVTQASQQVETKQADVNNDGKPDVTYYSDGKYVAKVEADTNYDGKPDVIMHLKDGKLESAEADTDYNGTTDKKFTDTSEFKKWVNENNPDFDKHLNRVDWQFNSIAVRF